MLEPNPTYWNPDRTPKARFVFDNVISKAEALELVADSMGKIDIVTELTPAEAKKIEESKNAKLVRSDAKTVLVGVFNRSKDGSRWDNAQARKAINMAVDREGILKDVAMGYGTMLPSMIVPGGFGSSDGLKPYSYDVEQAKKTLGAWKNKTVRIVSDEAHKGIADAIVANLNSAGLKAQAAYSGAPKGDDWDIWLVEHFDWSPEWPAGVVYREFFGEDGGFRKTKKVDPGFAQRYAKLLSTPDVDKQKEMIQDLDKYLHDQADLLFLYAPAKLFAVSKRVNFVPYKTTMLELAETSVNDDVATTR